MATRCPEQRHGANALKRAAYAKTVRIALYTYKRRYRWAPRPWANSIANSVAVSRSLQVRVHILRSQLRRRRLRIRSSRFARSCATFEL
jgi:hypothetical protein